MGRFPYVFLLSVLTLLHGSPCALATSSAYELAVRRADAAADATSSEVPASLVGAWTLVRVDNVYPDGHRVALYGPHPEGLWIIDAHGRYMMQMVRATRTGFAANDKSKGTAEEYRAAALDSNAHYGQIRADDTTLHTHIEHASFPNWDGKSGGSAYTLKDDELTYTVAKPSSGAAEGAHGEVEWRRLP
ncbi:lipocalin-like domain-containing protein [Rhodanobacter sp. C01]|uniref:lipocalin-like domain-containing protein n=1 Tax=Rhodanobacter sp. C01 TaxID=1945856 RepID=UPI0009D2471B|nr:lipocalin-like domain-containing protein [Rhodanobacter sp. C01]OOG46667.1 hypothetical protein B0E50_11665 [Rhodanobacter sp. C01]